MTHEELKADHARLVSNPSVSASAPRSPQERVSPRAATQGATRRRNRASGAARGLIRDFRATPATAASPMRLTLPYPPSANRYWRTTARIIRGKPVVQTYPSPEAKAYKVAVARIAAAAGWRPFDGDVELRLTVYRPLKRGDLSNRIKVLEDALNGIAYADDDQVVRLTADRKDDKDNPRVEVEVREVAE